MDEHLIFPHTYVSDMEAGQSASGFYILTTASVRTTGSGRPFLSASVSDRSGTVNVICWDYNGPLRSSEEGKTVFLQGQVTEFKGNLQINLESIRPTGAQDIIDLESLVPVAPIDADEMYREILSLTDSIRDSDYQAVAREFLNRHGEAFRNIPAAKTVHHSFLHGLLMHTGNMVKIAAYLGELYRDTVNRDLLITGTLIHDFAKREEFCFSGLGLVSGYSVKGDLLGHLVMGAQDVKEIGEALQIPEEKSLLLQHMLVSHHGKPEYGAAVMPLCAEAELLYLIDTLDSRMEIYRENLRDVPLGQFSDRIFALDGRRIYRHYDPDADRK